jgi:hypothetical protein
MLRLFFQNKLTLLELFFKDIKLISLILIFNIFNFNLYCKVSNNLISFSFFLSLKKSRYWDKIFKKFFILDLYLILKL